jgi:hypothetical protein
VCVCVCVCVCVFVCVCRRGIGVEEEVNNNWLIGIKEEGKFNCGAVRCGVTLLSYRPVQEMPVEECES